MKPDMILCYMLLLLFLALTLHKPQRFGKMLEQLTKETFPLNDSTRSVNVKEKIVHGCGPFNINISSFVITFEVRRLS